MTQQGLAGFRATIDDVREALPHLDDKEWTTPSAAAGWDVKDVVNHLGDLLSILVSAVQGELTTDLGIEALNDADVAAKRDWTRDQVLEGFDQAVATALPVFASLQEEPTASIEVPFVDLGRYPLHVMPDMCCFDFYTHLRWDILGPRGPLTHPVPAADATRLIPAIEWMLAGIPKMQPELPAALAGTIDLALTGPGGGVWRLVPAAGGISVTPAAVETPADATVTSAAADFVAWGTTRIPWRDVARVSGDARLAVTFLDALNLT
jgi:uncharacterized protein (TIGR03083 family)